MDLSPQDRHKILPDRVDLPKAWVPAILSLFVLAMGLYTSVATARIVRRTYNPVIFWDQWAYVDLALQSHGWPSWSMLWAQGSEHRPAVGRLAGFLDLHFFGGRNVSLLIELYLIPVCFALLLIWMLRRVGRMGAVELTTASGAVLFFLFCPIQIDNFVWGVQVGFVLAGVAAASSFACLVLHASAKTRHSLLLALSLMAAFLAECCLADGLLAWPVLIVLAFALRLPKKTQALIAAVSAAAIAAYFWRFQPTPDHANPWDSLRHPLEIGRYVLKYFAATWDSLLPPGPAELVLSECMAALAILAAGVTIVRHLCLRRPRLDPLRVFLSAVLLFSLSAALITSLGRLKFGIAQAAANRYQCIALVFWAAAAILAVAWAAGTHRRNLLLAVVQAALLALMIPSIGSFNRWERIASARQVRTGRAYVAVARNPADVAAAGVLNPAVVLMPAWYGYLRSHHLGPDPAELEARLPQPSAPAPIRNWAGHQVVPALRCTGWIDSFEPAGQQAGTVVLTGWAWDREAGMPPREILFATPDGWVVGSAEMDIPREDVGGVVKEVTGINTGWEGVAAAAKATRLRAFAVLRDTTSICPLPNEVIVP